MVDGKKIASELLNTYEAVRSKEYKTFRGKSNVGSNYEKICHKFAKFEVSMSPSQRKKLEETIDEIRLNITPGQVMAVATLVPFAYIITGLLFVSIFLLFGTFSMNFFLTLSFIIVASGAYLF